MNNQQIEKALKICAEGTKAKMTKCHLCPYENEGCYKALLKDASRYIERLKNRKKSSSSPTSSARSESPYSRKNGKSVQEWLKECAEKDRRNGVKDCGDIPY